MNKFWRSKISIEKYKSLVSHSNVEKVNDARQNGENNMKRKERDMSSNAKIDMGEKLAYGFGGSFGASAINFFTAGFILIFYTEIMKVDPLLASSVIGISKLLDGLSDLVAGRILDNTHHKMGKTRIWLLRMIPFTIVSVFSMYLMPMNMGKAAQAVYMFITYNLASTVCYTMVYVAYMTLNGLITTDQKTRGMNAGLQMMGAVLLSVLGNATIITLLHKFSGDVQHSAYGDRRGWLMVVLIYMIIYVISELILIYGTRERVKENTGVMETQEEMTEDEKKKAHEKSLNVPFLLTMKALFTNKYWIINLVCGLVISFLMGLESTVASLICTYVLKDVAFYQVSASVNAVAMLLSMLLGFVLLRKMGKRNAVLLGLVIRVGGGLVMAVNISKMTILLGGVMAGIGYGIAGCAFASVIQDTLTYGEWKNGFSMIGMGNAANSFCNKVGNSLGTIVMGAIMSATGYVAGLAVQPASAIMGFKAIYIYIPIILEFVAIIAVTRYDLDKFYDDIQKDLEEGKYAPGVTSYFEKKAQGEDE